MTFIAAIKARAFAVAHSMNFARICHAESIKSLRLFLRRTNVALAGGRGKGIIFKKGEVVRSVRGQQALLAAFMEELTLLLRERAAHKGA